MAQSGNMPDYSLFNQPPHNLASTQQKVKRPVLVLFEIPNCNACRRFHNRVLADANVRKTMSGFHAVQLDASDN